MLAVTAERTDPQRPLSGLHVADRPEPVAPEGWTTLAVRAASLNHHDVWTLRGVGIDPARLPVILGMDAAGVDADGQELIVHAVVGDPARGAGDETLDPRRSALSEIHDGTFAELVAVPRANLVPKPAWLTWEEAACLPTAWLTAYRMLLVKASVRPGATILVQGAGGGVATALIALGRAAGYRVWVTSRSEEKRQRALTLGAHDAFSTGARLPDRVDAVMDTVGQATLDHSLKSLRPGGTLVLSGVTGGATAPVDLSRVFYNQIRLVGSVMGTRRELEQLIAFCDATGVRPVLDSVYPLAEAAEGFARMVDGQTFGKVVFTVGSSDSTR
jgi:NADPH:quinone reductase-like Zn-dependent oxidoreductase